jgi:hypothetical protein
MSVWTVAYNNITLAKTLTFTEMFRVYATVNKIGIRTFFGPSFASWQ